MESNHVNIPTFKKLPIVISFLTQEVKEVKALLMERPAVHHNEGDQWPKQGKKKTIDEILQRVSIFANKKAETQEVFRL